MKNLMKKVLVLTLAMVMVMSMSVFAFAEDGEVEARPERTERAEKPERQKGSIITVFETHYPEMVDSMKALLEEHEAFHLMAKETFAGFREEMKANKEALKEQVKNEEITREEAKVIMTATKENMQAVKAEIEVIKADKKAANEALRALNKEVRESLKAALQAEVVDEAAVQALLNELYNNLQTHIDNDYYYFNLMMEVRNSI